MPAAPAEIVPELLMPPEKTEMPLTEMPLATLAAIVPELVMPPAKVDPLLTRMPAVPEIVPLLVMPP